MKSFPGSIHPHNSPSDWRSYLSARCPYCVKGRSIQVSRLYYDIKSGHCDEFKRLLNHCFCKQTDLELLVKKLSERPLESIKDNDSALFQCAVSRDGIKIITTLFENDTFYNMCATSSDFYQTLCTISLRDEFHLASQSAFYLLARSTDGHQILRKLFIQNKFWARNSDIIKMVFNSLCKVLDCNLRHADNAALILLAEHSSGQDILIELFDNREFLSYVHSEDFLNALCKKREILGDSTLFWFATSLQGRWILTKLFETESFLNNPKDLQHFMGTLCETRVSPENPYKQSSALDCLIRHPADGHEILRRLLRILKRDSDMYHEFLSFLIRNYGASYFEQYINPLIETEKIVWQLSRKEVEFFLSRNQL